MENLKALSLDLTIVSVVSIVLCGVLPNENDYKSLIKYVAELLSATLIITCFLTVVNFGTFEFNLDTDVNNQSIEEYILDKNTAAYLKDVEKNTRETFQKHNVNCVRIEADSDDSIVMLKFFVDCINDLNLDLLSSELSEITQVKSLVIVGGYDE